MCLPALACWIGSSQGTLLTVSVGEMKLFQLIHPNCLSPSRAADQQHQWAATHRCYRDHSGKANPGYLTLLQVQPTAGTCRAPCWARTTERAGQGCPPPPLAASCPSGNLQLSPPFQSQLLTCFLTLSNHLREELPSPRGQSWRWVCSERAVTLIMKYFARQSMLTPCFTTIWLHFLLHQI